MTVLVFVRTPADGRVPACESVRPELERLLGAEGCAALERLLLRRALRWAAEVAPGRVLVAVDPVGVAEPPDERVTEPLTPPDGELVDELLTPPDGGGFRRIGDAIAAAFSRATGPLLVAWPELPRWRPEHATAALGDLEAGCGVSVGPVFDGGLYLLALARPFPALLEGVGDTWNGPEAMGLALAAAHETGLEVGLMRAERGLRREADVRAALADPLLDGELATVLRGA